MKKQLLKDGVMWGSILWIIGYILGILLFMILPHNLIGWIIMPIGILITLWVAYKKIRSKLFGYYVLVGIVWIILAILLDYFLLVKVFKPADGYYKLDVYVYYLLTFAIPVIVGWKKSAT